MNKFTLNHKKLQLVLKSVVLNWARSLRCLHEFIEKQFENRHITHKGTYLALVTVDTRINIV